MKKTLLIYLLLILPALFLISCSEESSELEALESNKIHQPGVLDSTSANFHGKFFVQKNMKFTDCQKCHGKNLDGGITLAKSCSECHTLATIHLNLTGIQDSISSNFHGRYLLQHSLAECGQCHGKNYSGGSSSPSCAASGCHEAISVHKPALLDTTSADFHGKFTLINKFSQCQSCHGNNFAGGISSPSCATCHKSIDVHKDGIVDSTSANFHGNYLFKEGFKDCSSCHGANFGGGFQSPKCTDCHSTITVHRGGIVDTTSANFHGKYPLAGGKFTECQSCHGNNFQGGVNSPSCATSDCHKSIDVHKEGIVDPASANFHGKYQFKNGLADCSPCHGADFKGGIQSPACTNCHSSLSTHQAGIIDPNSPNFHGKFPLTDGFTPCTKCHGDNFQGSGISPTCLNCHKSIDVHKSGIIDANSPNFHGKYKLKSGLADCTSCHGATFTGGLQSPSCATCHSTITVHKTGIVDTNSPDFHGKYPLAGGKFTACQSCHGDNFQGGLNSPNCTNCHASIDVHKTGIIDQNSANFHGKYKLKTGLTDCTSCHGISFTGGTQSPSCKTCHSTIDVHKTGINDQNSPNFHGKRNELKTSFAECQSCHGDNFQGGNNSVSCTSCHTTITVHKTGITNPTSANFHGKFLKSSSWNISACASCHSSNFSGGSTSPNCKTSGCHSSAQGPAACNTCHGDFNNPSQISPPEDLSGNTSTSFAGVGAHVKHLSAYANAISLACSECHTVPTDVNSAGHLGSDGKAEFNFGTFTNKFGGTSYDFGNNKCANTYCHGHFEFKKSDAGSPTAENQYTSDKMVGNNRSPVWTNLSGGETKCFSCHGKNDADPSPFGHVSYTIDQCVWCHASVVDASGTIIDKTKHINGKINVFGTKFRK
ncbi:MAG: hypothetical protein AUJ54_03180 [Ignavibacteria bacterium CG1_02_37_35]|nr:MAG: hypothetical protein AUJ54_03180 [Ignavibacteria bacterium CG1_02_37_35]